MARLREHPEDLFALVGQASEALGLPLEFVEKDFWITELLRSVARPVDDAYVVFKGGTSLSKAFGLIERFSEDVDVLLVVTRAFAKDFGKGSVDKILKLICSRAGEDLGIGEEDQGLEGSGTGEHRNVRYTYPARVSATAVQPGVLLEMGVRGGPDPSSRGTIRSFISQYATGPLSLPESEYEEFVGVDLQVLSPERTLFEKLAILHHLATHYPDSQIELRRAARHLYDVYKLLTNPVVRTSLGRQPGLASKMASDIDAVSLKWGWPHTSRPAEGYAASPIFDASHRCQEALAEGWDSIRPLIYGEVPTLDQCRQSARESAGLL
jgi:Nucleotidyl transferase AbiEii toxin, Type IV TA system